MFITPAYAQTAAGGSADIFGSLMPLVLIGVIFYFLLIRPQQRRAKEHKAMVEALRRGDQIVTQGGLVGKVAKVIDDDEIDVELSDGVKVRLLRSAVATVRSKTEPAAD